MKKKIIFMGTPDFAANILTALLQKEQDIYEVVAVITQPDRAVGRKKILTPTPVKQVAQSWGLPVFQPANIALIIDEIKTIAPDLIVTAAYGQLVPETILAIPKYHCINVHASLLPKYRGGAPIHWAIVRGEEVTGITIMYMEKRLDAGAMLAKVEEPILSHDTFGSMYEKLKIKGALLLLELLPQIFAGDVRPLAQDDTLATFAPNIQREDERVDWRKSATEIDCHIRGLSPIPCSYTTLNGVALKIYFARKYTLQLEQQPAPGTIILVDKTKCVVVAGDGQGIALEDIQLSGKKRQDIQSFLQGAGKQLLIEGARFE